MQPFLKSFLMAAVLLVGAGLWGQEVYHVNDPDFLVQLSYDRSAGVQGDGVRHICVAVSGSGEYRVERSTDYGELQRLQGKMPKEQLEELKQLLGAGEFRALSGNHVGLIRQDAESFWAEIPAPKQTPGGVPLESIPRAHRLQWLNADGESPFPNTVTRVVNWLKHFEPTGAKAFEYEEYQPVCPRGGLRLLQPSVAENGRP
jgi:hypothetical protein